MALSVLHFCWWNQSAPTNVSHLYMTFGVDWGLEPSPCNSIPSKSQPWMLYLATQGGLFSPVCSGAGQNTLPVTCCLVCLFSLPPEFRVHISSKSFQSTASESIQHCQNYATASSSWMSPKICNHSLPVVGFISNLFHTVLPPDNGLMLLFQKPSHRYFLSLVEHTLVDLPHPVCKLPQGELSLLQADWRFTICTAQVWQIVTLIFCIIIILGHLWERRQVCNSCENYLCSSGAAGIISLGG